MYPYRLQEAVLLAYKERHRDTRGYSLAAIGLRGDAVVRATNLLSLGKDLYSHAECRCLRKMGVGGVIYVARVRKDGSIGMAKPCGGCRLMCKFKKTEVIYSIDADTWGVFNAGV